MKNYFEGCTTLDAAKALYKKLAFQLHPDLSGYDSTAEFQEMQNQFERFKPQTEKYETEWEQWSAPDYMKIIEELLKIKGIEIEMIGSFIWIGGDTRPVKDQIKAIESDIFKPAAWHKKKFLWYFAPSDYRKFTNKEFSMDELRDKYGSQNFRHNNNAVTK